MEFWELVRRLLAKANGAQTFFPSSVVKSYRDDLEKAGVQFDISSEDLADEAERVAEEMQAVGLIQSDPSQPGKAAAMVNSKVRTDLGEELYGSLCQPRVVEFFESMHAGLDKGEIQRLLHQLNS